ncbi:hypothetical protein ACHQM5_029001 [Ranunculus cassubicifolius]
MWHQKQNNEIFPGRPMGPVKSQGPHDNNINVPDPSDVSGRDHFSESSRKRKAVGIDYPGNDTSTISQSVLGSHWSNDSKHPGTFPVLSNMHEHGIDNTMRGFSKSVPSLESDVNVFYPGRYQSQGYPLAPQTNENNFLTGAAGKMDNLHASTQQQAFHQNRQSSSIKLEAVNIPASPDPQALSNILSLIEAYKHAYPDTRGKSLGHAFAAIGSLGQNVGNITHTLKGSSSMDQSTTTTTEFSRSSEVSQTNEVSNHDVRIDERILVEGIPKTAPSFEMKQNGHNLEVGRTMDFSPIRTSTFVTAHFEGNEGRNVENGDTISGEYTAQKLDGKSKSLAENVSLITEKLWDGSIHLSASMTVSAVAFFKSGEKAPESSWSKSIVLKGKVRLEAFERFIQELPRARSRGLMVTSLCWRAGSSTTGLAGMKAVAKVYKEHDKVGYATLNRGVDLYVCPRSDAIITILAKHGFFKGMAALEEDQDSFIGCVVWRKNHSSSSDSGPKKSKRKTASSPEPTFQSEKDSSENTPVSIDNAESKTREGVSVVVNAGPEKITSRRLELPGPVKVDDKDDDLPEFDFGVACGTTQSSVTVTAPMASTLPAPMPTTLTAPHSVATVTEKILEKIPKGLWDDDDDMPEWCPPDLDHQGGPKTIATQKPSKPKAEHKLSGPPPPPGPLPPRPSIPGPPPVTATLTPSFTYMPASDHNWKPENTPPRPPPQSHAPLQPPPQPPLPPPPSHAPPQPPPPRQSPPLAPLPIPRPFLSPMTAHPLSQTQGFPHGTNPSQQLRPPGGQPPSSGFTFLSAPRPPTAQPPGWRGW